MSSQSLRVRVPASTSNLGAGFDCIGLALDLWLEARLEPGQGVDYHGTLAGMDPDSEVVHTLLDAAGLTRSHRLDVGSQIPVSRGLGSSAAARVAALALIELAARHDVDPDRIFDETAQLEGHPDNAAPAVFGGLILAAHRPTALELDPSVGVSLAVPHQPLETERARRVLPSNVPRATAVAQAARAAALVTGLARGDGELIRFGMDDRIAVRHRHSLIDGFGEATAAAVRAGAYGVTISGSGSAVLALTPAARCHEVAEAMAAALTANGNPADPLTPAVTSTGLTTTPP